MYQEHNHTANVLDRIQYGCVTRCGTRGGSAELRAETGRARRRRAAPRAPALRTLKILFNRELHL